MDATIFYILTTFLASACILVEGQGVTIPCPKDYTASEGSCYKFDRSEVVYAKARQRCQGDGGDLVSITSEEENNFVADLADGVRSWIGGKRTKQDKDTTTFRWVGGTDPWGFENWRTRGQRGPEPNNWNGREHCVETNFVRRGWWNDHFCEREKPFVCEIHVL